ncbi:MAG: preprotein translocase subunit Sec61beta [Desulfurococcaceae archaeon]
MSKRKDKKRSPAVFSAAGLVRFFEESEAKVLLKPHLIIILALIFVVIIIALSKLLPPPV